MICFICFIIPASRVRRIPPERLANPNDPYYKCCCCTNLLKAAPILNIIGFILDIIVAIMGLIFALACTDKDAPTIVVALAYPLVTSLGFLGLVIANLKKKYALNRCWVFLMFIFYLFDMVVGIVIIILAFVLNSDQSCDYDYENGYYNCSYHQKTWNMTTGAQVFFIAIGAVYLIIAIFRLASLTLQAKIRNYWFYIIEKRYVPPTQTVPPAYQATIYQQTVYTQPMPQPTFYPNLNMSTPSAPPSEMNVGRLPTYAEAQNPGYYGQNLENLQNSNLLNVSK